MCEGVTRTISFAALIRSIQPLARYCGMGLMLTALLILSGCSGDPDEGGIIGSGMSGVPIDGSVNPDDSDSRITLRGAVSESALASNNVITVKSSDGVLSEIDIDSASQYSTTSLPGRGPWVLGIIQPSTDSSIYAIAYNDGTRNINRFSDLGLRSWFTRQSLNLDTQFSSANPFTALPSDAAYEETITNIFELMTPVLDSYAVTGDDIIAGDYLVNDEVVSPQGTDTFLKRNTVLIEQQEVKFLITDPVTTTQSQTRSSLTLDAAFLDNGSAPPSTPTDVKVLGSDIDEIVVVWSPSSDDVAVLEYEVMRDGAVIATTPYPVYIDAGLPAGQSFLYEIVAIDIAGNRSVISAPAFGAPLATTDTTPPPAPTLLLISTTSSSAVRLIWEQSNIGDVVAWNLFRGTNGNEPQIQIRTTSNVATDTTVITGETYCYQGQALDASGNPSAVSNVLCLTVGDEVSPDDNMTNAQSQWNVPALESLSCNQTLSSEQVRQGNTTLVRGCYQVPQTLRVTESSTLVIPEGTVLKFAQAAKLLVTNGGALSIEGSLQAPVILTGNISARGYWGGIEFQDSISPNNLISGAVIQYGGGDDAVAAFSAIGSRFRMVDTLMRFNEKQAFNLRLNNTINEFSGNRITENDSIGTAIPDLLASLAGNSDFTGNIENLIDVPRNNYRNVQITIPDLGVPLSWNGINMDNGSIQISPGTRLEMVPVSSINVDGGFTAIGTAENPIVIQGSSTTSTPNWGGIRLAGREDKIFNHVNIIDGGDSSLNSAAIQWVCRSADAVKLIVDNTEISFSRGSGISILAEDTCTAEIGGNINYFNNALRDVNIIAP